MISSPFRLGLALLVVVSVAGAIAHATEPVPAPDAAPPSAPAAGAEGGGGAPAAPARAPEKANPRFSSYRSGANEAGTEEREAQIAEDLREFAKLKNDQRVGSISGVSDLSKFFPPVGDQGPQGSGTAWALAYGVGSYFERLETNGFGDGTLMSPAFVFNPLVADQPVERRLASGLSMGAAIRYMRDVGNLPLSRFPYDARDVSRLPTSEEKAAAAKWRVSGSRRLAAGYANPPQRFDVDTARLLLHDRHPIAAAVRVDRTFMDMAKLKNRVWNELDLPEGEAAPMYQPVVIVGYDDAKQAFRVANSWGRSWADGGYAWLGYRLAPDAVFEAHVLFDRFNEDLPDPWVLITRETVFPLKQGFPLAALFGFSGLALDVGVDLAVRSEMSLKITPPDAAKPDGPAAVTGEFTQRIRVVGRDVSRTDQGVTFEFKGAITGPADAALMDLSWTISRVEGSISNSILLDILETVYGNLGRDKSGRVTFKGDAERGVFVGDGKETEIRGWKQGGWFVWGHKALDSRFYGRILPGGREVRAIISIADMPADLTFVRGLEAPPAK